MDEKNIHTCSEVYCLLNYFPESYVSRIPNKLLNIIKQNSHPKYFIDVDVNKTLEQQKITKETKNTLIVLKYNYWSSEEEKKNIIARLSENEKKYEEELRKNFNPDTLFKNKISETDISKNSVAMVEYKESFFTKIKNWLKRTFQ